MAYDWNDFWKINPLKQLRYVAETVYCLCQRVTDLEGEVTTTVEITGAPAVDPDVLTDVEAWIAANDPEAIDGTVFWVGGTLDDPDYAWVLTDTGPIRVEDATPAAPDSGNLLYDNTTFEYQHFSSGGLLASVGATYFQDETLTAGEDNSITLYDPDGNSVVIPILDGGLGGVIGTDFYVGGGTVQGTDGTYDIRATDEGLPAGNPRGAESVDLQTKRNNASEAATGDNSAIGGGGQNSATNVYDTVPGGSQNVASGGWSFAAGLRSAASAAASFALGRDVTASGANAIAVNQNTTASGDESFAGGYLSTASGERAFSFGDQCTASGERSIAMGELCVADSGNSVAIGYKADVNGVDGAWVFADEHNAGVTYATHPFALHLGFDGGIIAHEVTSAPANPTAGQFALYGIGSDLFYKDSAGTATSLLGGGGGGGTVQGTDGTYDIQAADEGATAGNARGENSVDLQTYRTSAAHVASGAYSFLGGGRENTSSSTYTVCAGGYLNTASSSYSAVLGGRGCSATQLNAVSIGGWGCAASGTYSAALGGHSSTASGTRALVGGQSNVASGSYSAALGGFGNLASGSYSSVTGGQDCDATASWAHVGGGDLNIASDSYCVVGGGYSNLSSGWSSTIPGGSENIASGAYAVATGLRAKASGYGQVSHASGYFSADGDAQTSLYTVRMQTADATQAELFGNGLNTGSMLIPSDSTWFFNIKVVARRTDADNESAAYTLEGCIDNNAGTTALVGSITKTVVAEDTAAWDVTVEADDTNDALVVKVTGEASKTIRWVAMARTVEVTG